ncbi:hypothetical protein [Bartonella vinsonii]|uniref:hypothetical protein n=2 Tax=Bartonella vinsonii TaxID=33047 RepID=UPI0002DC22C3|nr:hypothetical protein [Bartonella vinsonii]
MVEKANNKDKELTENERQLLYEMINTYQGLKMMSRCVKWIAFIIFMFIIDFARIMDALDNILTHLKRWLTKS